MVNADHSDLKQTHACISAGSNCQDGRGVIFLRSRLEAQIVDVRGPSRIAICVALGHSRMRASSRPR